MMRSIAILFACALAHAQPVLHVGGAAPDSYPTVQKAVDAAPHVGGAIISVAPGTYRETVKISKPGLRIRGEGSGPSQTIIVFDNSAGNSGGTTNSATVTILAPDLIAENITFSNDFNATHPQLPQGSQALALSIRADRAIFRNMRFLGNQDTVYAASGRQYFSHCYIEGNVDFLFGDGKTVFEDCELHSTTHAGGYITAHGKNDPNQDSGFVFQRCKLTAEPGMKGVWLGRPWRPYATAIFLNTQMGPHIEPTGWREWHPGETHSIETAYYAEYHSTGPGAHPTERDPHTHMLTADEATKYETKRYLAGSDHWDPVRP